MQPHQWPLRQPGSSCRPERALDRNHTQHQLQPEMGQWSEPTCLANRQPHATRAQTRARSAHRCRRRTTRRAGRLPVAEASVGARRLRACARYAWDCCVTLAVAVYLWFRVFLFFVLLSFFLVLGTVPVNAKSSNFVAQAPLLLRRSGKVIKI